MGLFRYTPPGPFSRTRVLLAQWELHDIRIKMTGFSDRAGFELDLSRCLRPLDEAVLTLNWDMLAFLERK